MRFYLLVLLLILTANMSIAQDSRFGFKAGFTLSHLGTDIEKESNSTYSGYHVGISYTMDLQEFGLQVEALYQRRGGQVTVVGGQLTERYDYLDFPIALKYYTGKGWNIHGGPYFGLNFGATQTETINDQEQQINLDEFISTFDYGFFAGVGYDFDMGLTIEIRYNYGMMDVDSQANIERRHRFGQISFSYFIIR